MKDWKNPLTTEVIQVIREIPGSAAQMLPLAESTNTGVGRDEP